MDTTQSRLIELLREVHLLASKEVERLNLRIVELESQLVESPSEKPADPIPPGPPHPEIMTEGQVAEYLSTSYAGLRRWRLLRTGPRFLKIGRLVRYRREDVDDWLKTSAVDVNRIDGRLGRSSRI